MMQENSHEWLHCYQEEGSSKGAILWKLAICLRIFQLKAEMGCRVERDRTIKDFDQRLSQAGFIGICHPQHVIFWYPVGKLKMADDRAHELDELPS